MVTLIHYNHSIVFDKGLYLVAINARLHYSNIDDSMKCIASRTECAYW